MVNPTTLPASCYTSRPAYCKRARGAVFALLSGKRRLVLDNWLPDGSGVHRKKVDSCGSMVDGRAPRWDGSRRRDPPAASQQNSGHRIDRVCHALRALQASP